MRLMNWGYRVAGVFLIIGFILNLLSGFCLWQRKHRIFSLVVAGINCVQVPIGTLLGVFTIIVLSRTSVREVYNKSYSPRPDNHV